ncbi:hypothetical protein [Maricaulis sp. MIT060901]|uniref:hypothetical protein n=1 Tax=Maricaulis sp. MIT060901 TaxID=3096993 RepID=UPI00399B0FAD
MAEAAAAAFTWVVGQGTKALVAAGFSKATATAIATFATKAAVSVALSAATSAILAPKVGAEGGALALNDSLDAGIPYVAGRRAVAGVLQHADEFGKDERYMGFINVMSGAGPVEAIESTRADSVTITVDGTGKVTAPSEYASKMWYRNQLGNQPETGHLTQSGLHLNAQMAGWASTEKLSGKAAHILTLQQDSKFKSFPAGPPVVESTIRGIKWYDPRLDSTYPGGSGACRFDDQATWVYSTNGAIHALGYALGLRENGKVVEGFGCPITDVVIEDFVDAANVADMNGWTCNAYWTSRDSAWQVYTAFLQAAGATHTTKWGKLGCLPRGAARVSLTTISAADTAAAVSISPIASRRDRINTITPKCPLESHRWAEPDLTPVKIQSYIDGEDGGEERERGVHYPFVTSEAQAGQLAAYDILDSREGMAGIIPVRPYLMDLDPGDCFTVTEPGFNLSAQKFLVHRRSFDFETGVSILHLISETDGKHALALGQSTDAPDAPSLTVPDPTDVPAPAVSVWTAVAGTGDQPNLVVSGATDNATATHVRIEYRLTTPSGGGSWPDDETGWAIYADFPIETETITVTGLEPSTSYQVAVSYISAFGVPGDRRIIATLSTGVINAGAVGGLSREQFEALVTAVEAQLNAGRDAISAEAADFAASILALKESFATGHATVDDAVQARLGLIDSTTDTLTSDIRTQARDTREALAVASRTALAVLAQVEENRTLSESVGNYSASFSSQIAVIINDIGSLTTQVDAWTAANVTGDITSALTAEINARVAGDAAQASRSDSIETTANDAQSKANEILALTVSPTSAIALKFSGIEQSVGTLQTNYTNIINLENIGGSSLLQRFENIEAQQDPATPGGLRARIDEAAEIQIADNAARTREIRETQASVARAALTIFAAQETFLTENEATLQLIEQANLAIGANTAGFQSIIDMTLNPASGLVQRFQTIELDLDETEAGSLAADVADHEFALFDGVAGLSGRMSTVETALNPGTEGSIASRVAGLEETRVTDNAATARELRELWATHARSNVAFRAQVEAFAGETENTLTIIEQARLETAEVDLRVDSILDLSIVDGTALGTRLNDMEAVAEENTSAITNAAQVQASDNAAVLRLLRESLASTSRVALMAQQMVYGRAEADEGLLSVLETLRVSTDASLASLEETKITNADLETAFALFGWDLSAAYDVEGRLGGIDENLSAVATVAAAATTVAEAEQLIADYQVMVGTNSENLATWVNQHATAIETMQGGGAAYALELGVGDRIQGLYALNDGQQRSFVFDTDVFKIWDGEADTQPFVYDTVLAKLKLQNIAVAFADIEDLQVDRIHLAAGAVGTYGFDQTAPTSHTFHTNPSLNTQAGFTNLGMQSDWIDIQVGDRVEGELNYTMQAGFNTYTWLYFQDSMSIEVEREDGSTTVFFPPQYLRRRRTGYTSQTGGGDGSTPNGTDVPDDFINKYALQVPSSGWPWHSSGNGPVRVRALATIKAVPRHGTAVFQGGVGSAASFRGDTSIISPSLEIRAFGLD